VIRGHDDTMAEVNQIGNPVSFGYLGERGSVASLKFDDFDGMGFDSRRIGSGGAFWFHGSAIRNSARTTDGIN
jgi:hypothetical protein